MLHRFLRLWFNEQLTIEADLILVLDNHLEESSHVVELSLDVSVEQRLVALTTSPEHCRRL